MNSINSNYSNMRLVGLASGLDTDSIIQQLMYAERMPMTKLEQQRTETQWKQEAYRDFTNALRGFKEKFFDITKKSSYLLSENSFKTFSAISSSNEYITARGTATAQAGNYSVKVEQLATADRAVSEKGVSKNITGDVTNFDLEGESMVLILDGVTREIRMSDYTRLDGEGNIDYEKSMEALIGDGETDNGLQRLVNDAFGEGKIMVSDNAGQLQLSTGNGATQLTTVYGSEGTEGLKSLGISQGDSNRISTDSTLLGLANKLEGEFNFNEEGNVSFEINGEEFTFSQNDTMSKVMETINDNAKANVNMRYDEITDTFSITAKQTGAGDNVRLNETSGSFFSAIGIDSENPISAENQGTDAIAVIDGVRVARSSNTFTVNGVEYTLRKAHTASNPDDTITLEQDIDGVYDLIESFVEEYNNIVDKFTTTLSEKYDRSYKPLSDDEKAYMTEDQIEKWEQRAKSGILRNDSLLEDIQRNMRMALMDTVEGVGMSLSSIGISSKSYMYRGKLYIDETKLKDAIRQRPDEVKNMFIQRSESTPTYDRDLTPAQRNDRYKEQGLLFRLSDILDDNISTIRNDDGKKGILLERAGMVGDLSEFNSALSKEISDYDTRIGEMLTKLVQKESNYYNQFTRLETYINQMNSQMSWLTSQLGGM